MEMGTDAPPSVIEVDQKAAVAADELSGRETVLDILERHIGFMLYACVAMHNTFPVKDLDKVNLGDRDLQSGTLGNDAQVWGEVFVAREHISSPPFL